MLRESKRVVSDADGGFHLTGIARSAQSCVVRADDMEGGSGILTGARPGQTVHVALQAEGLATAPEDQTETAPWAM